jgi:hypothetical protein
MPDEQSELLIRILANISDYMKKMDVAGKRMQSFGASAAKVGRAMTLRVSAPIALLGGVMIKMGMDAQESENLFTVAMGNMGDAAREWSEDLSDALGLNSFALRENVATLHTMFESMGFASQEAFNMASGMTELAHDMASFFNLKPDEAFMRLRAGITGEIEPLKRLGILVGEQVTKTAAYTAGIAEFGKELTEVQKVQARWLTIQKATVKASGDLARTLDSPTNRLRRFKESMEEVSIQFGQAIIKGEGFTRALDALDSVAESAKRLANAFTQLHPDTQANIIQLIALGAAAGPTLAVLGNMAEILGGLAIGFAAVKLSGISLGATLGAGGPIILALALLAASVGAFAFVWKQNWGNIQGQLVTAQTAIKAWAVAFGQTFLSLGNIVVEFGKKVALAFTDPFAFVKGETFADIVRGQIDKIKGAWADASSDIKREWELQTAHYREQQGERLGIVEDATKQIKALHAQQTGDVKDAINEQLEAERLVLKMRVIEISQSLETEVEAFERSYQERRDILERAIAVEVENKGQAMAALQRLDIEKKDFEIQIAKETAQELADIREQWVDDYEQSIFKMQELDTAYRMGNVAGFMEMFDENLAMFEADLEGRQAFMDTFAEMMKISQGDIWQFASDVANTAFDSISAGLSNMITGANTVKEAFAGIGKALIKVFVDYVVQRIVASIVAKAMTAAESAISASAGLLVAKAWAPAAAMVSLATFGANAAPAMAGIAATVGLANLLALATPMAEGGIAFTPTLALIGEGSRAEAVVPLGRMGEMGGGGGFHIENLNVFSQSSNAIGIVDDIRDELKYQLDAETRSA